MASFRAIIDGLSRKGKGDTMAFRVIKPFLTGSIAIVHESNSTMLIVKEGELSDLIDAITGARVAPVKEMADELQAKEAEER